MLPYTRQLKQNSRELRSNMTDAEQKFWYRLRRKQINGWQFYRQKIIGSFIVDFYCPAARLMVELDGSQHFEPQHQATDQKRDAYLESLGLRVLRFDNRQVLLEMDAVLGVIAQIPSITLEIPPNPPFSKGGENPCTHEAPILEQESTVFVTSSEKDTDAPIPPFEKGGLGGICVNPSMLVEREA
ncbi:endonuclease domain-containing protein [Candidatus Nitrotoga sp. M5]|uniref:endonuclease domain-containing protein n=1 Tax=Candidatus Nitrotoga sp. M5 TaxID=2890409 RepID=UPI001EF2786B|nr:endonuclease domain-containing protein [Candidatus Nitrotoga sp. M5]CAH1385164.1 putative Ribonuclease P [Candidatus Nitrotoga sp. M5]